MLRNRNYFFVPVQAGRTRCCPRTRPAQSRPPRPRDQHPKHVTCHIPPANDQHPKHVTCHIPPAHAQHPKHVTCHIPPAHDQHP